LTAPISLDMLVKQTGLVVAISCIFLMLQLKIHEWCLLKAWITLI